MSSEADFKLAAAAAGFTIGFGILTVWEAVKQTKVVRYPLRSHYVYMIWGEILVNLAIGIIAWLLVDGVVAPTIPVLFLALFLWVFEIQLLMQIIINRTAIIVDDLRLLARIKWGTAIVISIIQIIVFCIWIPAHSSHPPSPMFGKINKYWDPTSKSLICVIDAALNYYFIRSVKERLVKYHGLVKYAPLVSFNARLLVVSVSMDVMLIGLMFLPNGLVYTQFHPVAYMVKLNIEMTMASLIKKIALASTASERDGLSSCHEYAVGESSNSNNGTQAVKSSNLSEVGKKSNGKVGKKSNGNIELSDYDINKKTVANVSVEDLASSDGESLPNQSTFYNTFDQRPHERGIPKRRSDDEISLRP
ncbi:hypothetical protein VE04_01790 [Pseudogymnoascus sp. 24MN13]|nr:hypothetical protein VE04_01790 [Pseudogymnoascus sp. 24MN13]